MVWDTTNRAVAVVDDMPAIGLSAETAKLFVEMLNSREGVPNRDEPKPTRR